MRVWSIVTDTYAKYLVWNRSTELIVFHSCFPIKLWWYVKAYDTLKVGHIYHRSDKLSLFRKKCYTNSLVSCIYCITINVIIDKHELTALSLQSDNPIHISLPLFVILYNIIKIGNTKSFSRCQSKKLRSYYRRLGVDLREENLFLSVLIYY